MDFNNVKLFSRSHPALHSQTMMPTMKFFSTNPNFDNFETNMPFLHLTASQSEKKFTNPNFVTPTKKVVVSNTMLSIIPNMAASPENLSPPTAKSPKPNKILVKKSSPNTMFYRNLIEEVGDRKRSAKVIIEDTDSSDAEIPPDWIETWVEPCPLAASFKIISQTPACYEIRFNDAKIPKPVKKPKSKPLVKDTEIPKKLFESNNFIFINNYLDDLEDETSSNHSSVTLEDEDSEDSYYPNNMENQGRTLQENDSDDCIVFGDQVQTTTTDDDDDDDDDEEGGDEFSELPSGYNGKVVNKRVRCVSDCDSEDSFIMFAEDNGSCIDDNEVEGDESTDGDDESNDSDDDVDEPDCPCPMRSFGTNMMRNLSKLVNKNYCSKQVPKKVQFKPESELATVHPMIKWSYAYQTARKGHWEEAGRDRTRFQSRIRRVSDTIKHIFTPEHRCKIYTERFQS